MNDIAFVFISVAVAGFVGGITNHFAIKMLFHPRRPVRIGRWRIPFTPGLIPKRREEIGASLGKIVSRHLVTPEGLVRTLGERTVRDNIEGKLRQWIVEWTEKEETVEQIAARFLSPERTREMKAALASVIRVKAQQTAGWLWETYELDALKLHRLVPGWADGKREELAARAADMLLHGIREEVLSPAGERLLRDLVLKLLDQAGGLFGTLAGIFMDENKLAQKLRLSLAQQLEAPYVRRTVKSFMEERLERVGEMTVAEAVRAIANREAKEWLLQRLESLPVEAWVDELSGRSVKNFTGGLRDKLLMRVPEATDRLIRLLQDNMERFVASVDLPALVEREVAKFPIERVERMILDVTGKEFRAITWLGVLLGGLIGLIQSLLIILFR